MGDIAEEDEANYGIRNYSEDDDAGYDPSAGRAISMVEELMEAARSRGLSVHLPAVRDQWGRDFDDHTALALGDPRSRLAGETKGDQLARESAHDGRRISRQVAWARAKGFTEVSIEQTYGPRAQRIRRAVTMASAVNTDDVRSAIARFGLPSDFVGLVLSNLPAHMVATALMSGMQDDRFPAEPPLGSVLSWDVTYPGSETTYTYVALHAGDGSWWMTGKPSSNPSPTDWADVRKRIGNHPCQMAIQWGEIPVSQKSKYEGMSPDEWFEKVIRNRGAVDSEEDDKS